MRGGGVDITEGVLSMKNDNGINFFDTATPVAQYSIFQNNGYLNFHNYAEPINTGFPTQINFAVYNLNPTVPRFHNRLTIDYTAVQVRKTVFQVYDYDENGCCELQQTTGNSTILRNKTNSGSLILQTTNSSGSAVSNITMTSNNTTIDTVLTCNKNITLPSTYTTPISGQLGYKLTPTYIIHSPAVNITSLSTYYVATLFIPNGVWMVYGQVSFACTGGGSIFSQEYSISSTSGGTSIDKTCLHTTGAMTYASGFYITTKISGVISNPSSSSQIASNLLFRINITNGTYQMNTTSDTYVQYYAVRIA
jgi:hypothetical protein